MVPFNEDEIFYRDYYRASQAPEELQAFLGRLDPGEALERRLIIPELFPDRISYNMEDSEYFSQGDGRSIFLTRHNRYTPAFLHRHAFFEIAYVCSGHCAQSIGLERLEMGAGDISFIAPGTFHTMEVFAEDGIVYNILLRHGTFYEMFAPLIKGKGRISEFFSEGMHEGSRLRYLLFRTDGDETLRENVLRMYEDQERGDAYTDQFLIGCLTMSLAYLMRYYHGTLESSVSKQVNLPDNFLVMNYIQEHLTEVTLADVARHFSFSVSYCSRLIKSSTGLGFHDWKRVLRLRRAEHLLRHTDRTVAEIGTSLGYVNPETFIRAFRKEFHMSPTQYRRQTGEV